MKLSRALSSALLLIGSPTAFCAPTNLNSCKSQRPCTAVTVNQVASSEKAGCSDDGVCLFKVCFAVDHDLTECSKSTSLSHHCLPDPGTCFADMTWGQTDWTTRDDSTTLAEDVCTYAKAGETVYWVVKDANGCVANLDAHDVNDRVTAGDGYAQIQCAPHSEVNGAPEDLPVSFFQHV
jgi:hypothetical protein